MIWAVERGVAVGGKEQPEVPVVDVCHEDRGLGGLA